MKIVFIHGLGQSSNDWERTISYLVNEAEIINIDLSSLVRNMDVTYENLYLAFAKTCDEFTGELNLCGLSLGSILALNYAIYHPEKVHSMVLITPQYKMPKALLAVQNLIFKFIPNSKFESTGFKKTDYIRLCKTMMNLDFSDHIHVVNCPVLVICGEKDKANRKAAITLAKLLKKASFEMVKNSGHEINVDRPEELGKMINLFLSEND